MSNTAQDEIKKMYESQLKSTKEQLTNDYNYALSDLDLQKNKNQQETDANLNRTAVEAEKRAMSDAEYYAASGLTSGAKAQARIARDNQAMADMATIRAAQQTADAEVERQRGLLAKEYASAISKAQAENDYNLAKALYEQAAADDQAILQRQTDAAKLLAENGDYTLLGQIYGLTQDQINALNGELVVPNGYLSTEEVKKLIAQILAGKVPSYQPESTIGQSVASPNQTATNNSGINGRDFNNRTQAI